jgi:hypothetical protein
MWLATVGDVAGWWRTRSRAAARVVTGADGALTVEVASGTAASALDVVVYLRTIRHDGASSGSRASRRRRSSSVG